MQILQHQQRYEAWIRSSKLTMQATQATMQSQTKKVSNQSRMQPQGIEQGIERSKYANTKQIGKLAESKLGNAEKGQHSYYQFDSTIFIRQVN